MKNGTLIAYYIAKDFFIFSSLGGYMKKWNKWLLLFLISGFLVACGKDNNVSSGTTTVTDTTNTVVNEGLNTGSLVQPTSLSHFKTLVSEGKFISAKSYCDSNYWQCNTQDMTKLNIKHIKGTCTVSKDKFWIFNTSKTSCNNAATTSSIETVAGEVTSDTFGTSSRGEHINKMLELINQAQNGRIYGYQVEVYGSDSYTLFDLSKPLALNPMYSIKYNSSTSATIIKASSFSASSL